MNADTQALGHGLVGHRAILAGAVWEDFDYFSPSLRNFVGEYIDEARPRYVGNRLGESVVPEHPLDVHAFHSNLTVARNQLIGNFMPVFVAQVSNSRMQPSNFLALLGSVFTSKFLAGKRSLCSSQLTT
jgi:hypothetical protein